MHLTKRCRVWGITFYGGLRGFCVYGDSVGIPTGLKSNPHGSPAAFVYVYIIDVIATASCHAAPPAFALTDDVYPTVGPILFMCAAQSNLLC